MSNGDSSLGVVLRAFSMPWALRSLLWTCPKRPLAPGPLLVSWEPAEGMRFLDVLGFKVCCTSGFTCVQLFAPGA